MRLEINQIEDVLKDYNYNFKNKVVYFESKDDSNEAFATYFTENFKFLGLKQLRSSYEDKGIHYQWIFNGEQLEDEKRPDLSKARTFIIDDPDEPLMKSDVVVTIAPIDLTVSFIDALIEMDIPFIVVVEEIRLRANNIINYINKDAIKIIAHKPHESVWVTNI